MEDSSKYHLAHYANPGSWGYYYHARSGSGGVRHRVDGPATHSKDPWSWHSIYQFYVDNQPICKVTITRNSHQQHDIKSIRSTCYLDPL
jgi:hypothetical protein